jgi:hypothetical protein
MSRHLAAQFGVKRFTGTGDGFVVGPLILWHVQYLRDNFDTLHDSLTDTNTEDDNIIARFDSVGESSTDAGDGQVASRWRVWPEGRYVQYGLSNTPSQFMIVTYTPLT